MRTAMGSYHLRPFGQPCIEGFFGGRFARELEDAGGGALAAQAIDEIVALLGSDFRRRLKPLAGSRWAHDPFARGAYSHALPGHAGARAVLGGARRRSSVLCRRSHLAEFFLDRARGKGQRREGGGGGGGGGKSTKDETDFDRRYRSAIIIYSSLYCFIGVARESARMKPRKMVKRWAFAPMSSSTSGAVGGGRR